MDIKAISIGPNPPQDLHAIIEIPLGGAPVKYELDKASGALRVDRFLHTAMFYPGNYGFVPHTLSADGDPCDVLVVSQVQVVPGAIVRRSAFIAKNVVLMPSFVNLGAYVDESTMIDTWSTVGSCAQIGKRVHISGGVGIGGVLEPLQAEPVIVEDDCFIGARSEVAEGVIVRKGAVLAMGVFLGASTKIIDRDSGETFVGEVPEYAVVVPGTLPARQLKNGQPGPSTACAVIVKRVDERTRAKTSINELLRD